MARNGMSKHDLVRRMIIMEEFEKSDGGNNSSMYSFPPGVRLISPDDDSWD